METSPAAYAIDPSRFAAWQEESREIDRLTPIFVIGPNKCGTTWMARTLSGHHAATGLGDETHLFNRRLAPLIAQIEEFAKPPCLVWKKQVWLQLDEDEPLLILRQMADRVVLSGIRRERDPRDPTLLAFVEKTPDHSRHVRTIARLYPKAKFVCCTRDVRDAVVSAWKHMGLLQGSMRAASIESFALNYIYTLYIPYLIAAREAGAALGPERYCELSYETRREDDETAMTNLFRFLGLDASKEAVAECLEYSAFERLTRGRPRGQEAESFFRKGIVGDWVNHMTPQFGDALLTLTDEALGRWSKPPFESFETAAATA